MRYILVTLLVAFSLTHSASTQVSERVDTRLYLWFDLGNVLVETRDGFDQLRWMPGAFEMINKLEARGFRIGLISNVPESWGRPGDLQSKIDKLQEVLNQGWVDENPIELSRFDKILLPLTKADSKPSPILFDQAITHAVSIGKDSFFQGESPHEISTAAQIGMETHLVEFDETGRNPIYFPIDELNIKTVEEFE